METCLQGVIAVGDEGVVGGVVWWPVVLRRRGLVVTLVAFHEVG